MPGDKRDITFGGSDISIVAPTRERQSAYSHVEATPQLPESVLVRRPYDGESHVRPSEHDSCEQLIAWLAELPNNRLIGSCGLEQRVAGRLDLSLEETKTLIRHMVSDGLLYRVLDFGVTIGIALPLAAAALDAALGY